jgi:hypothetical protein
LDNEHRSGRDWIALAVRVYEGANDTKTRTLAVEVLAVTRQRTISDDAFDIPLATVEKKTHERLLVVGVATRVSLDDEPEAFIGEARAEREEKQKG